MSIRYLFKNGREIDWSSDHDIQALLASLREHIKTNRSDLQLNVEQASKKMLAVNWNTLEDVNSVYNQSKNRLLELKRVISHIPSKRERGRNLLEACQYIMNTDISECYSSISLSNIREFYVYAHLDTSKKIAIGAHGITTFAATLGMDFWPFYVGKGSGVRSLDLSRNETHRKICQKLVKLNKEPKVIKLADKLTESEALQMEAKLIDIFGLLPYKGYLTNLDEGVNPIERRTKYQEAYWKLRRINQVTHVNNLDEDCKTRVVPATSTDCSREASNAKHCGGEIDSIAITI